MNFCAMTLDRTAAENILSNSITNDWAITGEWVLLSLKKSLPLVTKKVDWLDWEDPFWTNENKYQLKKRLENDPKETIKRIKSNIPFLNLMLEDRFLKLNNT